MEKPSTDNRIVMTLDAGGTNLVFSAVCDNRLIIDPITLPSSGNDLDRCLQSMVHGFEAVKQLLPQPPVAISFAFPGPADYPNGIIGGNLPNFPAFRSGVALGPFLQDKFGIPVFINNDGDLFAYGEAFAGRLPEINAKLEALGSPKRYHNLIGYTFGTGFGVGIVSGGRLHIGDNSCVETFCLYNCIDTGNIAEATVSAGGIRREYARLTGNNAEIDTKEIYDIVLAANRRVFELAHPGVFYYEMHNEAARVIAEGLRSLGLMRGNMEDAVAVGAQALFMPHGLGHQMGLDVHDMENIGEKYVGYDEETLRSSTPGLSSLRMGKRLREGFVITVEPGIYFIPDLIDKWEVEGFGRDFIDFAKVREYLDFGGIRIEDNMLITPYGNRLLGNDGPPVTTSEIESYMNNN